MVAGESLPPAPRHRRFARELRPPRSRDCFRSGSNRVELVSLVALLASIGYAPRLTLGGLDKDRTDPARRRLQLQVGVAGFAFGNIMLFALPTYFGLDSLSGPMFQHLFGYLSLALALPVLLFSAADYFRSAWLSARQRVLTLDVPIALGLAAIYGQAASRFSRAAAWVTATR